MAERLQKACPCLTCCWNKCFKSKETNFPDSTHSSMGSQDSAARSHKQINLHYVGLWDFSARTEEEISFIKGDLFQVSETCGDWLKACKLDSFGRVIGEGFIPYNYVAQREAVEAQSWFFENLSRSEAVKKLMSPTNRTGAFLIRVSEKQGFKYVLSVRNEESVKHFKIFQNSQGEFHLNTKSKFKKLEDLIEYYKSTNLSDGLILTTPCLKQEPVVLPISTTDDWERPREEFTLMRHLGEGNFGEVFEGLWRQQFKVAIKVIKRDFMKEKDFQAEIQIMKTLRHKHILSLYATCSVGDPYYIITEFMTKGNLLDLMRSAEGSLLQVNDLIDMAYQVADGMEFLESKNYVHRDLAARNILVGEDYICKVADFGMARLIKNEFYKSTSCHIPYKWTAPEALQYNRFSTRSDVWSFGILLYEIITCGQIPYAGMDNAEASAEVSRGYRMPQPSNCPNMIYKIMSECWKTEPSKRPTFQKIKKELGQFDD
ncbi:protein-tyrosine kinase 6 isoform X2 [Microcaecilia unicolor]|uniref:Tyrosine-protein kinase n=1 Tax=Microcaecilia unicolor TaxID=1415580 RepID=A0A6P7YKQ4_9AMPH|nr:protein-tyrosine kinase 6 isoform X2 [Microcaecilia unicolor]